MTIEEYKKEKRTELERKIKKTNKKIRCIKNLYKSTFNQAFNKNKYYHIIQHNKDEIYILDEWECEFYFKKIKDARGYFVMDDYFDFKNRERKLKRILKNN